MNRAKIVTFIVLSYGISWLIWGRQALDYQLELGWTISKWNHLLGGLGPFLAAVLTTAIFDQGAGLKAYFREKLWTLPAPRWLLIGWGLPIVFFLVAFVLFGIFQGEWVRFADLGQNAKLPSTNPFLVWLLWCVCYGLGEEGGWRGFLLPELTKRFQARTAALLLALVWAPWHLPIFFYDKDLSTMGVGGTIGWVVGLTFGSLLLAWIVIQSRWNLWPVILWHGTFNFFTTSERLDPLFPAVMSMLVILLVVWVARTYGEHLDRSPERAAAPDGTTGRPRPD
jgi:membrane protease YdiL (CAAX protease family)